MPTFKNTNDLTSTIDLFYESINYRFNVDYPSATLGEKPYVDHLNYEFIFYGRVDFSLRPRILVNGYLKPVRAANDRSSGDKPVRLVAPIAAAANAFFREYKVAYAARKIDRKDPFLADIKPIKGYTNFAKGYNEYIKIIFSSFMNTFIPRFRESYNNVRTFDDFMRAFKDYNLLFSEVLVTPSAYLLSRYCDPFVSGLMFSIADVDPADNEKKYKDFIQSPNAVYFRKLAIKHGFSIDKYRPWVLVADLRSPVFSQDYTVNTFFDSFYSRPHSNDIDMLRSSALRFYNQYVNTKKNDAVAQENGCSVKAERIKRQTNSMANLKKIYTTQYWVEFYAELKIREVGGSGFDESRKKEIIKTALELRRLFGVRSAVRSINAALKNEMAYRTGAYYQVKQKFLESQRNVNDSKSSGTSPSGVIQLVQQSGGGSGGSGY